MEYEDELERMKARKGQRRTGRGQVHQNRSQPDRREALESRKAHRIQEIKRKKKKRTILMIEMIVLAALLVFAYFFFIKKDDKGYWTIAVFGVDSRDGKLGKGALSDVEMICNIDKETGEIKLVSVFRDTYLKIDSKGTYHKINEAYLKGGPSQAIDALDENLDLQIEDYVTFNWKSVADAINILGGIDLEITDKEFAYINSFITETVEYTGVASRHLEHAGMNHLDGVQAVAYSRLRLMDTDFNRTERQRKVVSLAMEKAKTADFAVLNNILVTVLPQVSTSVGIDDLIPIARNLKKYHIGDTAGFPFSRGTTKIGKMDCVIPTTLESNVSELHFFLFGAVDYTPSAAVRKISSRIAKESGMGDVGENAETGKTGGSSSNPKPTKEPEAPSETAVPETAPVEETTQEVTATEGTTENESTERPTDDSGNLIGPGAEKPVKPSSSESSKAEAEVNPGEESETKETTAQKPSEETTKETQPEKSSEAGAQEHAGPGIQSL